MSMGYGPRDTPEDLAEFQGYSEASDKYQKEIAKLKAELTEHEVTRRELERQIDWWKMYFETMSRSEDLTRSRVFKLEAQISALTYQIKLLRDDLGKTPDLADDDRSEF